MVRQLKDILADLADAASLILMFLVVVFGIPVVFMVFK
tara:strand:- start:756 stop:869 length:114 start_codon:yes stop_codon:yes gene_type:complete